MKPIEKWIKKNEKIDEFTNSYWNNVEEEKEKEWWIEDKNDKKISNYLEKSGLLEEFTIAIELLKRKGSVKGNIIDIAAGVCWTSALLSKFPDVRLVDALEFSFHRIDILAPRVLENFGAESNKVNRVYGSFYDIKRDNEYYDIVFLSQAFHHADKPLLLLKEISRVIKKDGVVVLIGEHLIYSCGYRFWRSVLRDMIRKRKFSLDFKKLFPPDPVLGDHYYRRKDYKKMFNEFGFSLEFHKSNIRGSLVIIGVKR